MTHRSFSVYLNISSLSCHHLELYNLISNLKTKPNIISSLSCHYLQLYNLISNLKTKPNVTALSETRLQIGKKPITNFVAINKQCLWAYPN